MEYKCENKDGICTCLNWKAADAADILDQVLRNNEFHHLEVDYPSLETGADIRLCEMGVCKTCGGRICIGTQFQAKESQAETMFDILQWASRRWSWNTGKVATEEEFAQMFSGLFRMGDQAAALEVWKDWTQAEK